MKRRNKMKRLQPSNKTNLSEALKSLVSEVEALKLENEKLKKTHPIIQETADGLEKLLGEMFQLWCLNYIYSGKLVGVNTNDVVLEDAVVVYETGKMTDKQFKFAEPVASKELFIRTAAIESYSLAPQLVK